MDLSGDKASIYSIVTETSQGSFLDEFISDHLNAYTQDLMNVVGRLKSIGNTVGAIQNFFKLEEGLKWDDLVCAIYDTPNKHLRLYCIRLSEKIVIVGNGAPKNTRTWQEDPKLSRGVLEMMHYSDIIRAKLKNNSLRISLDGLKFEGNLILTR